MHKSFCWEKKETQEYPKLSVQKPCWAHLKLIFILKKERPPTPTTMIPVQKLSTHETTVCVPTSFLDGMLSQLDLLLHIMERQKEDCLVAIHHVEERSCSDFIDIKNRLKKEIRLKDAGLLLPHYMTPP